MSEAIIAVDIGTTNIETILCTKDRTVTDYRSVRNEQRRYGSDVASRICSAASGHADEMRACVLSQLCGLIAELTVQHPECSVENVVIAGNTTMLHILLGYDCGGLGMYPFKTVSLSSLETTLHGLLNDFYGRDLPDIPDLPLTILPGISAYIGADIYAGAVACGFAQSSEVNMLIDLGTNAELIIGNKDRILTASAAAGPAFESGRIFKGTEGIEMMHRLLELGVIDRTGLMKEEYFEQPAQKNIRKLQLAKAAIKAAITILTDKYREYGVYDLAHIFISGNFGNNINETACIAVGMLPGSFAGRIVPAGNTVLEGCVSYILDPSSRPSVERIEEVVLANEPGFNDLLMNSIDLNAV